MKKIIEIHVLQNFAPSNLNRDDTGAPKDALFGGTRRARVSSQCQKKAVRDYFPSALDSKDTAIRTKRVLDELVSSLTAMGRAEPEAIEKAKLALAATKLTVRDDGKTEYLLFMGRREIAGIAALIHEKWDSIVATEQTATEGKPAVKAKKKAAQDADPEIKKALDKILNGGKAVDLALFGRMLADMPEKNQYAACQVAHAISTHAVEREFDFYTAVDNLRPEDTAGADMMGTVEFNSACFYRYAVVDWEKLTGNLQQDSELSAKGVRAFLEGFSISEPTGKQSTFAAHNPPEFIAVSVRHNAAPRNLANAFETAVFTPKGGSLTRKSAEALIKKGIDLSNAYGSNQTDKTFVLNLTGADETGFGEAESSLKALLDHVMKVVQE